MKITPEEAQQAKANAVAMIRSFRHGMERDAVAVAEQMNTAEAKHALIAVSLIFGEIWKQDPENWGGMDEFLDSLLTSDPPP